MLDRYDKMVPLPFGEYLPLADTFPILREWIKGPGDFRAGEVPLVFQFTTHGGQEVRFTTPICYEAILSSFVRKQLSDADLFVNVTNDGWFGDTAAPHQHGMLSAVRAVELGVPMVRLAYTGVSFNVSPTGRITNETEPFTEVIRIIESPVGRVDTVYRHIGDVFAWLCTLAAGGILLSLWRDRRAARGAAVTPGADPA
ncbi:MAG: apolipoprotein N-acyltransferase [Alphaproteobacteria bacterium]|nr:apolipoprotein N-acyltransferase [Alphaproteobacteria bacterium]